MPPWRMFSYRPREVSEAETPRQSQRQGLGLPLWVGEHWAQKKKKIKNQTDPLMMTPKWGFVSGEIFFRHHHFQKRFSYQNNPPTFPKDSASCSCVSPQEAVEVFQLFGKKKKRAKCLVLARGSWTALKAIKKKNHPLKLFCKCSQAFLQAFLSNVFSNLKFSLYCCK